MVSLRDFSGFLLAAGVLALAGCGDFERGKPVAAAAAEQKAGGGASTATTATTSKPGASGPDFVNDVHPILEDKCTRCHAAPNATKYQISGDNKTDYDVVFALVTPGSPETSRLIEKSTAKVSHGGGAVLDTASQAYGVIANWITAGAPYEAAATGATK